MCVGFTKWEHFPIYLFISAREVFSIQQLREAFTMIVDEEGVSKKLQQSLVYFGAFEYQHWQGDYEDRPEVREELMAKGLELFFADIDDIIDDDFDIQTPIVFAKNNWIVLSVLATTMSQMHPRQQHLADVIGFEAMSPYDLLKNGLLMKDKYLAGEEVPRYVSIVLENERIVHYLMQLRHNFFPFIIVSKLSDFEDGLFKKISKILFSWDADLSYLNMAQYQKWSDYIDYVLETRSFLSEIGIEVQKNSFISKVFSNMHLQTSNLEPFMGLLNSIGYRQGRNDYETFKYRLDKFYPEPENQAQRFVIGLSKLVNSSLYIEQKD